MSTSYGTEGTFRLGQAFSQSFSVFGRHFVAFVVLTVLANIPNYVFQWGSTPTPAAPGALPEFDPWAVLGGVLALPVSIACSTIATGAITYGVVQDLRDEPVSIGEAIAIAARRVLPMFGVALVVGILVFLGSVLFVVPGFIVACMYFVAAPVCIAEREGVGGSLRRSRFLTKGHRWKIFGAFLLILVPGLIVVGVIAAGVFGAGFSIDPGGAPMLQNVGAATVAQDAVAAVFGAFYAVLVAVFYYHLRVAKEGVDLAKIASVFD
jgi:hypothetical protein